MAVTQSFQPIVLLGHNSRPVLVFAKGRTKFHAITTTARAITLTTLNTLRGLAELQRGDEPYPPQRAASFWLNRDHREVTKRAREVLRGLVRRKAATE